MDTMAGFQESVLGENEKYEIFANVNEIPP
jgi:hypothetical protein